MYLFLSSRVFISMRISQLRVCSISNSRRRTHSVRFSLDRCDPICLLLRAGTNRFFVVQMRLIGAGHLQQVDADEAAILPLQFRSQRTTASTPLQLFMAQCAWVEPGGV